MFIVNAKIYQYFMNLLFLCVIFLCTCPLHMCGWVYVSCMGVQCDCSRLYVFSGGVCAAIYRKVCIISEIRDCMCQCTCHSYPSFSYWLYKCDIFLRYSNVWPSFLSLWYPWYLLLFHVYACVILISLLSSMICRSVVRWLELWTLYV
jgi:hypothetical protein